MRCIGVCMHTMNGRNKWSYKRLHENIQIFISGSSGVSTIQDRSNQVLNCTNTHTNSCMCMHACIMYVQYVYMNEWMYVYVYMVCLLRYPDTVFTKVKWHYSFLASNCLHCVCLFACLLYIDAVNSVRFWNVLSSMMLTACFITRDVSYPVLRYRSQEVADDLGKDNY